MQIEPGPVQGATNLTAAASPNPACTLALVRTPITDMTRRALANMSRLDQDAGCVAPIRLPSTAEHRNEA